MLRRMMGLILCLMLPFSAWAENGTPMEAAQLVENLFAAAAGVEYETEATLRKQGGDGNREKALAEYRTAVFPWLCAAFQQDEPEMTQELLSARERMEENALGQAYLEEMRLKGNETPEAQMQASRALVKEWMKQVNHEKMLEINRDYACWLYLPGTPIDYPVVHTDNNSTYLHYLFDGSRNKSGTLFLDYRNLPDFQDPNTLIYGHHMRNGTMFGMLTSYDKEGFFAAHPYALIFSEQKVMLVAFFAGYITSSNDPCYDLAISDVDDLQAFSDNARTNSGFHSYVEIGPDDSIVTFSTCAYAFENARYILIGKLIPVGDDGANNAAKKQADDVF